MLGTMDVSLPPLPLSPTATGIHHPPSSMPFNGPYPHPGIPRLTRTCACLHPKCVTLMIFPFFPSYILDFPCTTTKSLTLTSFRCSLISTLPLPHHFQFPISLSSLYLSLSPCTCILTHSPTQSHLLSISRKHEDDDGEERRGEKDVDIVV